MPFNTVHFNEELNVILGNVSEKKDKEKDSHNLGKSTLISLVDFLLLKRLNKNHFLKKNYEKFSDHEFYLELLLNNGTYLTIRRAVSNNTKISFKLHEERNQNFATLNEWDESNLPLEASRDYLNKTLGFNVLSNWDYRKSVTYFLRSQYDYQDVFQLSKFSRGKDIDWKPFMFDLLNFEGELIKSKYQLESEKNNIQQLITEFQDKFSVSAEEVDKIRGAIDLKENEKESITERIDSFSFYENERELNRDLIEDIESEISELNTLEYELSYEIERIKNSLSEGFSFDLNSVEEIFKDSQIYFNDELKKDYNDLINFNNEVTNERNKFLKDQLNQLQKRYKSVLSQLESLDKKRSTALSVLKEKETFQKFKRYQVHLATIEAELARLEEKLASIDKIKNLKDEIDKIDSQLRTNVEELDKEITQKENSVYKSIRRAFAGIVRKVLNVPAIIFLTKNNNNNVEFNAEIQSDDKIDFTSESKGASYKKMLCMAFDVALLSAYSNKSFYKFVIHDGALEGLDHRKKENFIDLMRKFCRDYNIQYIFTSIEDDIPKKSTGELYVNQEEIAVSLNDSGEQGTLFKMNF